MASRPRLTPNPYFRRGEDFDRGFYAGPFGTVGRSETEIAVAIRTARVDGDRVEVYAGAGVVEGSTAEGEWRETEDKVRGGRGRVWKGEEGNGKKNERRLLTNSGHR